jgi:rare lipoprotein A
VTSARTIRGPGSAAWLLLLVFLWSAANVSAAALGPQTGVASVYSDDLNGRSTASGERYDSGALTAAHRSLPLGADVKVTRLDNGKSVRVRINDRGPNVPGRIIDLSRRAATALGLRSGVTRVRLDVQRLPAPPPDAPRRR